MNENENERVQRLFLAALGVAEDRDAWLVARCGDDQALLAEVRSLLEHDSPDDDPLEAGVSPVIEHALDEHQEQQQKDCLQIRCPHCRNAIELVDENTEFDEVECPSCGSSFSLIAGIKTVSHRPHVNTTIGHFVLVQPLGTGAFGTVWRAQDTELDRTVAIKVPRNGQLDASETEQFLREARAAAQLRHPHIVPVHEVGREDDKVYIVSDYIDGITLTDWLTGQTPTPRDAVELCVTIADALHHAHEQGVIHRDLKPGNILLDRSNEPHLTDFGLAKREAGEITMTMDGQILGTPAYMSPEQAEGEGHHADRRTDVYSLGVVLFELLTGERPFRGNTRMLLHQVMTEDAPSPRKLNAAIPRDLDTICLKCLEKDPFRRYSTANDLREELRRWLQGEAIISRPISGLQRGWRWCNRNPTVAILASALMTALLAGTVISVYFAVRANEEARTAIESGERADLEARRADQAADAARENLKSVERYGYNQDILRVQKHWEDKEIEQLKQILDRYRDRPDLRGFEWGHWERLVSTIRDNDRSAEDGLKDELPTIRQESLTSTGCRCFAISPDGYSIATCDGAYFGSSDQGRIRIWDFATEQEVVTLGDAGGDALAFAPDGTRLAAIFRTDSGSAWVVKVWNTETALATHSLKGRKESRRVTASFGLDSDYEPEIAFSPDGERLAAIVEATSIKVWQAATGKELLTLRTGDTIRSFAFSPTGLRLAAATGELSETPCPGLVTLWDAISGREVVSFQGHADAVHCISFAPDGQRLASASETIKVWDAKTQEVLVTLRAHAKSIAYSPDGTRLVALNAVLSGFGLEDACAVWDTTTWQRLLQFDPRISGGLGFFHSSVAFFPDGERLGFGTSLGEFAVWDARPWTTEVSVERQAVELLQKAFQDLVPKDSVAQVIRENREISEPVRKRAMELAVTYRARTAREINESAWEVVKHAGQSSEAYDLGLRWIEEAVQKEADSHELLKTLGVAQYRVGDYKSAMKTLTRFEKSRSENGDPLDGDDEAIVFLAMAAKHLGDDEKATERLQRFEASLVSSAQRERDRIRNSGDGVRFSSPEDKARLDAPDEEFFSELEKVLLREAKTLLGKN